MIAARGARLTAAGQRQAVTTPQRRRAPAPSRRATAAASLAGKRSAQDVAQLVAEKEQELSEMFVSGRIPKASTVAAVRKELAELRAELQGELGIGGPAATSSYLTATTAARSLSVAFPAATSSVMAAAASAGGSGLASSGRVLNALKLVEAQLAASREASGSSSLGHLSLEQQQQLLSLQEENTELKSQLDNVLARQAQLQLLWDQHASGATAAFSTGGTNGSTSTAGWTNGSVAAPGLQPAAATW